MSSHALLALMIGGVAPLGERAVPSGIAKSPVSGPVDLGVDGFAGDAQGDTRRHGGPEKAVHHYPFDHYAAWRRDLGDHGLLAAPGAFGENISTAGLTEDAVSIGDVFALGGAVIEVSQGRQPCWKLNERFGVRSMAKDVQSSGRTGWYYRVLQAGRVGPGDSLDLIERRSPEWTLARLWRAFYVDTLARGELEQIAVLPRLAEGWRGHAAKRLQSNRVEDWSKRLHG